MRRGTGQTGNCGKAVHGAVKLLRFVLTLKTHLQRSAVLPPAAYRCRCGAAAVAAAGWNIKPLSVRPDPHRYRTAHLNASFHSNPARVLEPCSSSYLQLGESLLLTLSGHPEQTPSKTPELNYEDISHSHLKFHWDEIPLQKRNGIIQGYTVYFWHKMNDIKDGNSRELPDLGPPYLLIARLEPWAQLSLSSGFTLGTTYQTCE
ncbi:uncharacterized protein [Danio rerio]|uniref:Uncharacterized protein n=1 Tax=Danio rerio TaxID=7955 RepID=A0AC58HLN3_DANRE